MTDWKNNTKLVLRVRQVSETKIWITLWLICHVRQRCNTFSALREKYIREDGEPEMLVPSDLYYVYSSWVESRYICRGSNRKIETMYLMYIAL